MRKIIFLIFSIFVFFGCSSKQLKQYGSNLALSGNGNITAVTVGAVAGGTLYSIGTLIEKSEKTLDKKDKK